MATTPTTATAVSTTVATGVGFYNQPWFVVKTGNDLIYESMTRILLTNPGQRVMLPTFGVGINQQVFALVTPDILQDLAVNIHSQLATYEPRVVVLDVTTELLNANTLQISIISQAPSNPTVIETTQFNVSI
jgi:phage baseplate assembly protein W